jgi:hypothetical protein
MLGATVTNCIWKARGALRVAAAASPPRVPCKPYEHESPPMETVWDERTYNPCCVSRVIKEVFGPPTPCPPPERPHTDPPPVSLSATEPQPTADPQPPEFVPCLDSLHISGPLEQNRSQERAAVQDCHSPVLEPAIGVSLPIASPSTTEVLVGCMAPHTKKARAKQKRLQKKLANAQLNSIAAGTSQALAEPETALNSVPAPSTV